MVSQQKPDDVAGRLRFGLPFHYEPYGKQADNEDSGNAHKSQNPGSEGAGATRKLTVSFPSIPFSSNDFQSLSLLRPNLRVKQTHKETQSVPAVVAGDQMDLAGGLKWRIQNTFQVFG
jgi:hypothetical protein